MADHRPARPRLADRDAVAKALPPGHTLDQVIHADSRCDGAVGKIHYVNPITLEDRLAEVGVRVGQDGKLRDAGGKEITFRPIQKYGCQMPRCVEETDSEECRKWEAKYRVIYFDKDPGGPEPC